MNPVVFKSHLIVSIFFLCLFLFNDFSYPASVLSDDNLKIIHDKIFSISPGNSLVLDASSGDVVISSWDKNEVNVKILGNDQAKNKVEFSFKDSKDVIRVQAKYSWALSNIFKKIQLKFEIKVPQEFNIDVTTAGGEIKIQDVKGKVNTKTSGGDISLANLNGKIDVSTTGGNITFRETYGSLEMSTSGGDINGNQFSGVLKVSTTGGDISLVGKDAKIVGSTSGGDIMLDYDGINKGIELSTSGGDITIKLPKDFNASAKFSTLGGSIKSDFKGNNAVKISSTKFEADINSGGNSLLLKTSGGDIVVKKK